MLEKKRNDSYHINTFMPVIWSIMRERERERDREIERDYCQKLNDFYI